MELFSVTCITCRAVLKVRHVSAVGQILACPRCQGMVQIEAPPGWKPPAAATSPGPQTATASPPPSREVASAADDPLTGPGPIVAPHEARLRRWILLGGGLVALLIIAFGLSSSFRGEGDGPPVDPNSTIASATPSPTSLSPIQQRLAKAHATPSATPAPSSSATPSTTGTSQNSGATAGSSGSAQSNAAGNSAGQAGSGTQIHQDKPLQPSPSATSTVPPVAVASATSPPIPAPSATAPPMPAPPMPVATATASGTASSPPVATVEPNKTPPPLTDPPQVVPPPSIDLAARLQDRLPDVALDGVPLNAALGIVSQLSTIRIGYDWDSPVIAALKLDEPLRLRLEGATAEAALDKLLAEKKLRRRTIGDQLLVTGPEEPATATIELPLDDLAPDAEQLEVVLGLVVLCVAPESWQIAGGRGTLAAAGGKLRVEQSPRVQRELADFLDRLRKARGKSPRDPQTSLATRLERAAELLQKPVTMNFRPGAPLDQVLARLAAASGGVFTIDHLTLASLGFDPREPIGCSAHEHPTARVLDSICTPRDWAWRVVNERTIEITGRAVLRRRIYAEFYELPKTTGEPLTGTAWAAKIRTQFADDGWRDAGGRGTVVFDELSQRLIVAQHQEAHQRIDRLLAEARGDAPPAQPPKRPAAATAPTTTAAPVVTGTAK